MNTEEVQTLLLALDPIVHAEPFQDYDYGYGGLYPVPGAQAQSLRTILSECKGDWGRMCQDYPEVQRLIEDWPEILLAWKDKP